MIYTNYVGMRLGAYEVIAYRLDTENAIINLIVRCGKCGETKKIKLAYEEVTRIKCNKCSRLDVVIPIEYYNNTRLVKDTITIGAYKYRKIKSEFNRDNQGKSESEFIRNMINNYRL